MATATKVKCATAKNGRSSEVGDSREPRGSSDRDALAINVRMIFADVADTTCLTILRDIPFAIATAKARNRLLSSAPIVSIVDDDESVRAAMSSFVRSLGYKSCVFCSAEDFLISPRLNDTCCLIADVQMPGMSGMELQDELTGRRPDMPVIFITAFPVERVRKRAAAAGAVAFFSKPVDSHALIGCLEAALRRS
jgi:CheY-like chemotaxis protein